MKDIKTAFLSFFGHKGKGKIICIIGIVGILLIFISSFFPLSRDKEETVEGDTSAAYAARLEEQLEEMARLRERKCLRDRRTGRRTKTNKIRMQEGSAVLRESVFPSFIFYSAKDGKK